MEEFSVDKMQRFKIRYFKEKKDKKLLYIERVLNKIYLAQKKLGYITLDKPVKRGYKKTYRLKEKYRKSSKAKLYLEALKYINTVNFSNDKDFKTTKWHYPFFDEQPLLNVSPFHYNSMSKDLQNLFIKQEHTTVTYKVIVKYKFSRPEVFELYVSNNMVTKIKKSIRILFGENKK